MPATVGQALDGGDLAAVDLDRKHAAGFHRMTVQQDGAGAQLEVSRPMESDQADLVHATSAPEQQSRFHLVGALFPSRWSHLGHAGTPPIRKGAAAAGRAVRDSARSCIAGETGDYSSCCMDAAIAD